MRYGCFLSLAPHSLTLGYNSREWVNRLAKVGWKLPYDLAKEVEVTVRWLELKKTALMLWKGRIRKGHYDKFIAADWAFIKY